MDVGIDTRIVETLLREENFFDPEKDAQGIISWAKSNFPESFSDKFSQTHSMSPLFKRLLRQERTEMLVDITENFIFFDRHMFFI